MNEQQVTAYEVTNQLLEPPDREACANQSKPALCLFKAKRARCLALGKKAEELPDESRQYCKWIFASALASGTPHPNTARRRVRRVSVSTSPRASGISTEYGSPSSFWSRIVHGLVVVASLGNPARYSIVRSNLEHFEGWDCIAYAYAHVERGQRFLLPRRPNRITLRGPPRAQPECKIVQHIGWGWASLLNLTTPAVVAPYTHVFVMLDDVLLPRFSFDLDTLLRRMSRTRTPVLSPTVVGASRLGMSPVVPRSLANAVPWDCVHQVPVVEVFATLFTNAAWRCFWSMFDNEVLRTQTNAVGWGYDLCFMAHCAPRGVSRQGVALDQLALHTEGPMSELAHQVELVRDAQKRLKWRLNFGDEWAANATAQLAFAQTRYETLERLFRSASEVFAVYAEEIKHANYHARASHGRRLSLQDSDSHHLGLDQAKRLRNWIAQTDRTRCSHPFPRLKRATVGAKAEFHCVSDVMEEKPHS